MVTIRTDGEVIRLMGKCVDFVSELIDYIAEYPDDDYMTMECLCRKLVKHGLIDKKDGYYLVSKGIKVAEQTEPQTDNGIGCSKCESRFWCMDRDMPHAVHCNNYGKTEPQTEETEMERLERIDNELEDAWARIRELTDEPQTDCSWK